MLQHGQTVQTPDLRIGEDAYPITETGTGLRRDFKRILSEVIEENGYEAAESDCIATGFIDHVESGLAQSLSYGAAAALVRADPVGVLARISAVAGRPVRRLLIAPCPDYMLECVADLLPHLDEVVLCDNLKAGRRVEGLPVLCLDDALSRIPEMDACFVATTTGPVARLFVKHFPMDRLATYIDVFRLSFPTEEKDTVRSLLKRIEAAHDPIVILASLFSPTLLETFRALAAHRPVFLVARQWVGEHSNYEILPSGRIKLMENHILCFDDMLLLLKNINNGKIIFIAESMIGSNWDAMKTVITYSYASGIMRFSQVPTAILLYDAVKPIVYNQQYYSVSEIFYKQMLISADYLLLNSNTEEIGNFLRNSCTPNHPIISFYRYSRGATERKPRLDGGFHLAAISTYLGDVEEPSRSEMAYFIRLILQQGIHFHYYSSKESAHKFREKIPAIERNYMHIHDVILDQEELCNELTSYSAGWVTSDLSVFGDIIYHSQTRFFKDLFALFVSSTIPSSSMVFASAGLPIFTNRNLWGIRQVLPRNCTIPLEMSEVGSMQRMIEKIDWPSVWDAAWEHRQNYVIDNQISRLLKFLE